MEKVLRETDDGILVYVAPTKALVNQIAADVHARFRKSRSGSELVTFLCAFSLILRELLGHPQSRLSRQ